MADDARNDAADRGAAPRAKDAATLVLVRHDGPAPRVLMGRRHRGHAFLPDKFVFPGGRVDRADFRVPAAAELEPDVAAALARTTSAGRARALAMAAIRETFEETGLMVARRAAPMARRGGWSGFLARGALPDLAALTFIGRAITPPARTRRFDARFFMADATALLSLDPDGGSGELDELAWFDWAEARRLDLPDITRAMLDDAGARLADPARSIPFHRFVRGRQRLTTI